jgi:hypothetical protein
MAIREQPLEGLTLRNRTQQMGRDIDFMNKQGAA